VLHSLPDTEVHAALKKIAHKPATANCRADVGALVLILYFVVAHSGQEESMFPTKQRGRTISLLTIVSSLFSASNLKHRSVLPSLTQRNESRMFHTVALATFFASAEQRLRFLLSTNHLSADFASFAKISTSEAWELTGPRQRCCAHTLWASSAVARYVLPSGSETPFG
jgi:hypothetical protein